MGSGVGRSENHQYEPKPGADCCQNPGNIGNLDELAAEAWGEVWKKIVCRASVATQEDYNALPELTRKTVPFGLLLTWGKAEDPGAEAFARRDFMNDYKILLAREQARRRRYKGSAGSSRHVQQSREAGREDGRFSYNALHQ